MRENSHKSVIIWLLTGCSLIFLMVLVGGITRLTNSGLSMVDWKLIMGAIPPIGEAEWIETFNKYKQFPEYQKINFQFTLEEFKSIFFWEYLHRIMGRLIGIIFLIPFIYFLVKKKITGKLINQCLIILGMGALQGFFGWWMVKSGLVKDPDVSHYRLAVHLITAFLTFAYTLWVALSLIYPEKSDNSSKKVRLIANMLLILTIIQIVYGAFVAGLDAGKIMNTYPKMGDSWIHESVTAITPIWKNFIEGLGGVQFIHRVLAHFVVAMVIYLYLLASKLELRIVQLKGLKMLLFIVFVQFLLGVFTLLYGVPIWLGVAHQIGAFLLLGAVVFSKNSFHKN